MIKQLHAGAMLAALCSSAAAQSNVTIYGVVDLSAAYEKNGAGTLKSLESGVYQGSRLGFRGTEDLGDGLAANFLLEMGINADTGALGQGGLAFGRQAYVGLSGKFGAVRLGRQYTPIYFAQLAVDPFVGGMKGDMASARGWFNNGGVRVNNSFVYVAPSVAGFNAQVLYGLGEVTNASTAGRTIGASASYAGGPLYLVMSYNRIDNATATDNSRVWYGGGTYDFGIAKLHAAIDDTKGTGVTNVRDAMVGASAPIGVGSVLASYIRKTNPDLQNATARQWSLGYFYPLSKRTALYTSAAQVKNGANSAVNAGGVKGATDKVFDVGVRHSF